MITMPLEPGPKRSRWYDSHFTNSENFNFTRGLVSRTLSRLNMNTRELKTWLNQEDAELVAAIVADVTRHVSAIQSSGESFYGYAVLQVTSVLNQTQLQGGK